MIYDGFTKTVMAGQLVAMALFSITGLALLIATGLAFAGVIPWPELAIFYGGEAVPWAGQAAQIAVTALFLLLAIYVPSNRHVMMLEATHRKFALSMDDITKAYKAVHLADRQKAFQMTREFDAVRERYEHLRKHPDLPEIDAELLTIAAQMSQQSQDLAQSFAEDRVQRAEDSLRQRKEDAELLKTRIENANAVSRELRRQIDDVEFEENSAASQLMRLREELAELETRVAGRVSTKGPHLRPVSDAS
ncbi:MAG: DNA repair protein [Pseudomonadota bacterium]